MKVEKLHKYVNETRQWIYPLADYAKENYPELSNGVVVLESKIISLTESEETLVVKYTNTLDEKDKEIAALKKRIRELESSITSK